ncbi:hypothetical protein [Burkholderia multivorans]|uniref:hypothetical protein n=1 Tax=Burkholderia multivorans TaxID=87883 RepID=UPI000759308E|nr:hypothetical protein [Burkholderia multivorans]KVT46749.1 hypothetical protein WK52_00255 [Burkholderia multivorans]
MATVTIELGSGKRATLTRATGADRPQISTEQRRAVSELMLHWPKYEGLATNALSYLRQLGLDALRGVPLDALRSAIEDGRVIVEIEKPARAGGGAGGQPSAVPFPRDGRVAKVASMASLPIDKPIPSWAQPSDVTADELIGYLESVVGGSAASGAAALVGDAGASTPFGDAAPFAYSEDAPDGGVLALAGRVSEEMEAECHAQYMLDMEMCAVKSAMLGGSPAAYSKCAQDAFANYQSCRGY